jgi:hypothetical protein
LFSTSRIAPLPLLVVTLTGKPVAVVILLFNALTDSFNTIGDVASITILEGSVNVPCVLVKDTGSGMIAIGCTWPKEAMVKNRNSTVNAFFIIAMYLWVMGLQVIAFPRIKL